MISLFFSSLHFFFLSMMKVLVVGATGSIGRVTTKMLLEKVPNLELSVFSRHINSRDFPENVHVIKGSVLNDNEIQKAVKGQDIVFAALSGDLPTMAQKIVDSMKKENVERILFISSMGIYNEIPKSVGSDGNLSNNPILQPYRDAAYIVENSGLNYTIIRPGWFDNGPINYEISHKGEPFGGHDVSRKSIADLVTKIVLDPTLYNHESIGIHRKN